MTLGGEGWLRRLYSALFPLVPKFGFRLWLGRPDRRRAGVSRLIFETVRLRMDRYLISTFTFRLSSTCMFFIDDQNEKRLCHADYVHLSNSGHLIMAVSAPPEAVAFFKTAVLQGPPLDAKGARPMYSSKRFQRLQEPASRLKDMHCVISKMDSSTSSPVARCGVRDRGVDT